MGTKDDKDRDNSDDDSQVYDPQEDSFLMVKQIAGYAKGSAKALDMGTGSGILALEAAKYSGKVIAVDVSKRAVEELRKKVVSESLDNIEVRESDLFSAIGNDERFDLILFNPPYLPADKDYPDAALDGGKQGFETVFRFLKQAGKHLEKKGVILLLFSSLSKKDKIDKQLSAFGYKARQIAGQKMLFEELYVYEIRLE